MFGTGQCWSAQMAQALTVLLVDDDDLARESLTRLLEAHGCRVHVAASALEAMRILAQEHVDVLFTDIIMPDQDGIELAKQAKLLRPDLRVMFATGYYSKHRGPRRTAFQADPRPRPRGNPRQRASARALRRRASPSIT